MKKLDFVVAGAQKCGTTTLQKYIMQHPDIWMPDGEGHVFDNRKMPAELPIDKVCGESTPIYMWLDYVPPLIYAYNKKIKVICILRDPVDRAWSHYWMEVQRGIEPWGFWDAVYDEIGPRVRFPAEQPHQHYSYISRGMYGHQIMRLRRFFPKSLLVLRMEELNDPERLMEKVFKFIEVKPVPVQEIIHERKGTYPKMDWITRHKLEQLYEDLCCLGDASVGHFSCCQRVV